MAKIKVNHSKISFYEIFFSTQKRKTYTNLGVSLILIIVLLFFALRPTILTIGKIREQIKDYERVNLAVKSKVEASQQLAQQMSFSSADYSGGLKDEIDFLNSVFFADPNVKLFYQNMYQRANKNKVILKSLTPKYPLNSEALVLSPDIFDQTIAAPSLKNYEINLLFEAKELKDIEGFVASLEGYSVNPIVSRVKNFTINNQIEDSKVKKNTSSATKVISGSVTIIIYLDSSRMKTPIPSK